MAQRRSIGFPWPIQTSAWITTLLVVGTQVGLIAAAALGYLTWLVGLAGVVAVEIAFRTWRRLSMAKTPSPPDA